MVSIEPFRIAYRKSGGLSTEMDPMTTMINAVTKYPTRTPGPISRRIVVVQLSCVQSKRDDCLPPLSHCEKSTATASTQSTCVSPMKSASEPLLR